MSRRRFDSSKGSFTLAVVVAVEVAVVVAVEVVVVVAVSGAVRRWWR